MAEQKEYFLKTISKINALRSLRAGFRRAADQTAQLRRYRELINGGVAVIRDREKRIARLEVELAETRKAYVRAENEATELRAYVSRDQTECGCECGYGGAKIYYAIDGREYVTHQLPRRP